MPNPISGVGWGIYLFEVTVVTASVLHPGANLQLADFFIIIIIMLLFCTVLGHGRKTEGSDAQREDGGGFGLSGFFSPCGSGGVGLRAPRGREGEAEVGASGRA